MAVAIGLSARADAQQAPPRDQPPGRPPQIGTARLSGRVADGQTGLPVPRARVRLAAPGVQRPPVLTDELGAFQFSDLPGGSYFLSAEKAGYLGGRYPEAARTVRGSMRSLTVTDGQALEGVTVPLYHGGVITGRVTDAHGELVEFAQVQTLFLPPSGKGKPQSRGMTSTNDLGEFRAARLEPGHYLLLIQYRNQGPPDDPAEHQPMPTYYPGVLSIEQAQRITVERGQTASGVEIMMIDGTASIVTGTVVDAAGRGVTTGASVGVRQVDASNPGFSSTSGSGIRPDGTFRLKLAPGDYELEARGNRPGMSGQPRVQNEQVGIAHVSANGAAISGVTIVLGNPATVSGRIVFDGESAPPANPEQFRAMFGPPPSGGSSCRNSGQSEVKADWTFRVDGVFGTCVARMGGNTGKWAVRSVLHNDVDLQDRPMTFEPGQQLRDVQVVMTDRRPELNLHVTDEHGLATREYVALVFPVDKTQWNPGSRYLRTYVPPLPAALAMAGARTGTPALSAGVQRPESVAGLPPGDYYVIALEDIGVEEARDPDTFERLAPDATRVTLTDSGPVSIALTRKTQRAR